MIARACWLVLLLFAPALGAQLLLPTGHVGRAEVTGHDVVVVHRAGGQTLAVRPRLRLHNARLGETVWVLPLPAAPVSVTEADPALFDAGPGLHDRLFTLARRQWAARTNLGFAATPAEEPAPDKPAQARAAGATMTTLAGTGPQAIDALARWLDGRGYAPPPRAELDRWAALGCALVCVEFSGGHDLPAGVCVRLGSGPAWAPMPTGAGEQTLSLTLISEQPLELTGLMRAAQQVRARGMDKVPLFNLWSMRALENPLAPLAGDDPPGKWYVNRLESDGFDAAKPDGFGLTFAAGGVADELPGFWYYGDLEISWPERMFREHALAIFFTGGPVLFALLLLKSRQNRRRLRRQAGLEP
ncbi:MAG: hypothetical protein HS108_11050 [Planctomycetes bacterium]|jgi:hypothetical protein|nr:hypothetical protein [Planctomycetota bacterium]MCL4731380.1 hypothetical protein [Planctomycetota bacterium]